MARGTWWIVLGAAAGSALLTCAVFWAMPGPAAEPGREGEAASTADARRLRAENERLRRELAEARVALDRSRPGGGPSEAPGRRGASRDAAAGADDIPAGARKPRLDAPVPANLPAVDAETRLRACIQGLRRSAGEGDRAQADQYRLVLVGLGSVSIGPLTELVRDGTECDLARQLALLALQGLRAPEMGTLAVEVLQGSGAGPLLRAQALASAGTVRGDAALTRTVRDLATSGGVPETERASAFQALVASSPEEAIPILRRLLDSGEPRDRDAAVAQMQSARNRAYLPLLTEIVNSPNPPPNLNALLGAIASIKDKPWSALQLTGEPDTPGDGDLGTAWASKREDMGEVWLELDYERAVLPDAVRIHETLKPGTVAKVQARAPTGAWETLWEGVAPEGGSPRWFEPPLSRASSAASTIRLVLDTNRIPGWNEIDAVELIGGGAGQWAKEARASSSYSDP